MTGGQYVAAFVERDEDGTFYVRTIHSEGGDGDKIEVKELSKPLSEYAKDNGLSAGEALKSIRWIMRFNLEDRSVSHNDLYFQNVKNSQNYGDVRLRVFISFDKDHDGSEAKSDEARIDLGIDYVPLDHTWVGAKLGIFALSKKNEDHTKNGYADFRNFAVKEL